MEKEHQVKNFSRLFQVWPGTTWKYKRKGKGKRNRINVVGSSSFRTGKGKTQGLLAQLVRAHP